MNPIYMKHLLIIVFLAVQLQLFSQEPPKVALKDSSQLKLSSLNIDVTIVGNFANTTYDMEFYNELDRTLEGELAFPLSEGQAVSEFAMEVNGKFRKAVVVEKQLARRAFENTVRQNIDPGLLEKTQGNNYKARIYPILPKTNKRIVITFEQELSTINNFQTFQLPLGINEKLDTFSLDLKISGTNSIPIIKDSPYKDLFFKKKDNYYQAKLKRTKHTPTAPILVKIPVSIADQEVLTYKDYFYAHIPFEPNSRLKPKPKNITILWDASYSLRLRKLEEELKLLESYISYLQDVNIQFVSFSNEVQIKKKISITKGNCNNLKTFIKGLHYDGGTSFRQFNSLKFKSDEVLLFSDGMANLGKFPKTVNKPIYIFSSVTSADHQALSNIASASGGQYINLQYLSHSEAFDLLKTQTFQFLGIKNSKAISEVYPKKSNVTKGFSITGKFSDDSTLELLFGYGGKVTKEINIPITKSLDIKLVKRLWAKQKLKALNIDKEQNKKSIIALAKKHHLVTDYTSMLILDRIEDYVRYRIEPPQELKQEYKSRIKSIDEEEEYRHDELTARKDEIVEGYKLIRTWYSTQYPKKELKEAKKKNTTDIARPSMPNNTVQPDPVTNTQLTNQNSTTLHRPNNTGLDPSLRIVSGTVVGNDGIALPGVNVFIKGTTNGTVTNIDGNFRINAKEDDELLFSFIGFNTKSQVVDDKNVLQISLNEDESELDEVVVTAYGITRTDHFTGAMTTVVSQQLMSTTTGIKISRDFSPSSLNSKNDAVSQVQPMYIVDGKITAENPMNTLHTEDIEAVEVLKPENASKLYGSRASNGLIIITTKKGRETNFKEIEELNEKIAEKIELKSWDPKTPYIDSLQNEPTTELAYIKYLAMRDEFSNCPSFYLDVADFFDKRGSSAKAIMILTNLIEGKLDNHELMRALAYKLEHFKQYELAVFVYKSILELRPEEPQSYRDLALAYEQIGEIQKCFDLLYKLYNGELLEKDADKRFYGIEQIAYIELNRLIQKYDKQLNMSKVNMDQFTQMPVDIRVVIDWNHNDTDIDLWVMDPNGEQASYKNTETKIGGHMSEDLTEGYGPEEFMLKNAIRGSYKVVVDYYTDNQQKISGPTILKATIFTNYGRKNEQKKILNFRLDQDEDEIEIGKLEFN